MAQQLLVITVHPRSLAAVDVRARFGYTSAPGRTDDEVELTDLIDLEFQL
ncbi:hypothetical protein ABT270_08910 [Streptomyces sp900105245]